MTATATVAAAAAAVVLLGGLTGCSGDDGESDDRPEQAASSPALPTTTTVAEVTGRLSRQDRQRVKERVTEVVDDWLDAAFVAGDYPRTDFADAYPHFTKGAVAEARRDARLTSNAAVGDRVESVTATRRELQLDVLAVRGRPSAVTARFVLGMRLQGEQERADRVSGSLFLTRDEGEWRVFGFDVTRGRAR